MLATSHIVSTSLAAAVIGFAAFSLASCSKPRDPAAACSAPETMKGVRDAIFTGAVQDTPAFITVKSLDQIKGAELTVGLPRLTSVDPVAKKIVCAGTAKLKEPLPHGVITAVDDITYSVQRAADGSGSAYEVSSTNHMTTGLQFLASLEMLRETGGLPVTSGPSASHTENSAEAGTAATLGDTAGDLTIGENKIKVVEGSDGQPDVLVNGQKAFNDPYGNGADRIVLQPLNGSQRYVVVDLISNGTLCPEQYRAIDLEGGKAISTPSFGNCSDLDSKAPHFSILGDGSLKIEVPSSGSAEAETATFRNGRFSKIGRP